MNSRWFAAPARLLWYPIWVALAAYLALTIWLGILGLSYPYQLDYGEGIVLWFARELAQGHSIYLRDCCASSNYPPLAMFLSAGLMPLFGMGYVSGRLLNLTAAIVVAFLIYRIVSIETHDRRAGGLAACFFIGSPYIYHWVPLFRADLIGLGFAFAGVYFVWKYSRQAREAGRQKRYLVFAIGLFLLALYTKQTLIAAPAAAFLALFRRHRNTAIVFAIILGAVGGAIYLAIDYGTRGGLTYGLIDSNATVFLPDQLFALLLSFAIAFAVLLGLAGWEWICRTRARQFGVLEAYALTTGPTLLFAGRVGAWENYFFEAIAICCVFAGIKLKALGEKPSYQLPIALLLSFQLALYARDHDPRIALNLIAQDLPANQQLAALLSPTNGIIISEDMGALVTSGKPVSYYTFQYSSLARAGKWDQSWEMNGLRSGMFPLVILEKDTREDVDHYRRFTREFVSTLDRYYAQTQTIGKYEIYTAAPLAHLQSVNFGDAIRLIGWSAESETLDPGSSKLSIVWQAQRRISVRYAAFVHLENEKGDKITQDDKETRGGAYPTTRWAANEMVRETYTLTVPGSLAVGKYFLRVGWYDAATGERLAVPGSVNDSSLLKTFDVR